MSFLFASLHRRLLLLVTVALLPAALLAISGVYLLSRELEAEVQRAAMEQMRTLSSAVDNELDRSVASLEILSTTDTLAAGDLKGFAAEAAAALRTRTRWQTIILRSRDGETLVNVRLPQARGSRPIVDRENWERARDQRVSVVGRVIKSTVGDEYLFPVHQPVVIGGEVRYVLTAVVDPQAMVELIRRQPVPAGGVVLILDSAGKHVARSRGHAEYIARPPSASVQALMRTGNEGVGPMTTLEGAPIYGAFSRSPSTGWTVAVGIPKAALQSVVGHWYQFLGVGAALCLALGALAALLIASRIARPIHELRSVAAALGRGDTPQMPHTSLPEIREVSDALQMAGQLRRQAEQAREEMLEAERRARTAAEQSSRLKDEFLAMLSHELRNPIAAISNAWQILSRRGAPDEASTRALTVLGRQTGQLTRLVDDLLDVSRVTVGKIELARTRIDLGEIAEHCVNAMRTSGRLERHAIELAIEPVEILGDATRIEQVVANLVGNAIKYTPEGERIEITVRRDGEEAVLCVRDHGEGIAPELLPRVFDLFVQGQQPLDRSRGGLGVGLTLVRRLVELHGGTVEARSEGRGQGSEFTVRFIAVGGVAARAA